MITLSPPIYSLGPDFYDEVLAGDFDFKEIRFVNKKIFQLLGIDPNSEETIINHFLKFKPLPNNVVKPLALRYHGHQFHNYNPELGDGRGFLFAQFRDTNQNLFEIGTKGSGTTPYSRRGDGRLTLKGAVREALCSAYLEFQNVPTSKTFSIIETAESLIRYDEPSPTRSSVLTRYSHGHIRIGTFQRLFYFQNKENIETLTEYSLKHFYPHESKGQYPFLDLFFFSVWRLTDLVAAYMVSGFVHGVLNTDNINISGESFDYGPYRFLPTFDPNFTAAYFDNQGLYSFGQQPQAFLWNLEQLRKCLFYTSTESQDLFLNDFRNKNQEDLTILFNKYFSLHMVRRLLRKLNLQPKNLSPDSAFYRFYHLPLIPSTTSSAQEAFGDLLQTELLNELINSDLFKVSEELLTHFFSWISDISEKITTLPFKKSPSYEEFYFYLKSRLLNSTHLNTAFKPFEEQTQRLISFIETFFELSNSDQINYKSTSQEYPETLLIDEIETIWSLIDSEDDWSLFNKKIRRLEESSLQSAP